MRGEMPLQTRSRKAGPQSSAEVGSTHEEQQQREGEPYRREH